MKIADFGISKYIKEETAESTPRFTYGYQAPEVDGFKVKHKTSHGSIDDSPRDIWALGEICFQMLTKLPTFPNLYSRVEYFNGMVGFPVDELQNRQVSQLAQDFIDRSMKVNPVERLTAERGLDHSWIRPYFDAMVKKRVFGVPLKISMGYSKSAGRPFHAPRHGFEIMMADCMLPIVLVECGQYFLERGIHELTIYPIHQQLTDHIVYCQEYSVLKDWTIMDEVDPFHHKSDEHIKKLKEAFNCSPRFGRSFEWDGCTIHDVLQLLLIFITELPGPLFPWSKLCDWNPKTIEELVDNELSESSFKGEIWPYNYDILEYCLHLMDYLRKIGTLAPSAHAEVVASFGSAFLRDQNLEFDNKNPFVFLVDERISRSLRDDQYS